MEGAMMVIARTLRKIDDLLLEECIEGTAEISCSREELLGKYQDTAKSIKKDICGLIGGSDFSIFEWNNADLDEE